MQYAATVGHPEAGNGIFVVEDEGLIAHDLAATLQKGGYRVAGIASTGEEALQKLAEIHPSLILMDIRLGGSLDGIDLAGKVQERLDVPVVYLTAHSDSVTLDRAKVTGPFAYLTKPVSPKSLFTSIEIALFKHRAESELRHQRAWLQTVLSGMADGVIVTGNSGSVEYLNAHAETLTGWIAADAQGKPVEAVLSLLNLNLGSARSEVIKAAVAGRRPARLPAALHAVTREGSVFPVDGEIMPSGDAEESSGAVITFRNSTDRIKKETVLRHEQKMSAVGRLAGGVAHDFNNLLTVIIGFTDMAMNESLPADQRAELLREVRKASQTAASITQKLLTFSSKHASDPQPVSLNSIVRDNEAMYRHLLGPRITWSAILAPDLGDVSADPTALVEILMNLVTNARDAMPEGGHLTVQTANVELESHSVAAPETTHYVSLVVEDDGAGMDANTAEHLFEPFFTTKFPDKGTGLGLAIVDGIVRDMAGTIDVDSEPGLGTTFTLYLPRVSAPLKVQSPAVRAVGAAPQKS